MALDKNIEISNLQSEIGKYIGLGQNSLIFNFEEEGRDVTLRLITVNPRHNQSFLFHVTTNISRADALRDMLDYVKDYKDADSSYTIQWSLIGENILHTSYFRAKNVMGALDKLYFDRDPNGLTVFSVNLNPIS